MKKFLSILFTAWLAVAATAQETVYPAPPQAQAIALVNGTIHVGNGQVIEKGTVVFEKGKITAILTSGSAPANVKQIDCSGRQIYPGLILSNSQLGLVEVPSVRATVDGNELGEMNASIRSIVAYNTDSRVINTLRMTGILLANVVPEGGLIKGSSSVVQLDAWNWEDAAYKTDNGIHIELPSLLNRTGRRGGFGRGPQPPGDPIKRALEQIEKIQSFFREAKAYHAVEKHDKTNLKFEAVKGLFNKTQKLFVHCNIVKEMLVAVDFVKEFGFDVVIVGGVDSYLIAGLLKQHNIAVILSQMHSLPTMVDDDIDQPYKTPAMLQEAGVLFAINDEDGSSRYHNLPFNAGTAAAYGLSKEQALAAITLNAAKILGIAGKTGSIETGKDANIVVSEGDLLDMRSNKILHAFIQGREVELTDKHKQLYERYKYKYQIEP